MESDRTMTEPRFVYGCTNPDCGERMRGVTYEPGLWCSICLRDLTLIALAPGVSPRDVIRSLMTTEPTIHERDGWRWINRCPVCGLEAFIEDDDLWWCDDGHHADMPNPEIVSRPNAR